MLLFVFAWFAAISPRVLLELSKKYNYSGDPDFQFHLLQQLKSHSLSGKKRTWQNKSPYKTFSVFSGN